LLRTGGEGRGSLPNYLGTRAANGEWREWTSRRKEQKRIAAARFRERHKNDPQFQATQRAAKQAYRSKTDPNKAREQKNEKAWRLGEPEWLPADVADNFRVVPVASLEIPQFIVRYPDGRWRLEGWQSAEALERNLRPLLKMRKPLTDLLEACQ
jgi:hypothetical protein